MLFCFRSSFFGCKCHKLISKDDLIWFSQTFEVSEISYQLIYCFISLELFKSSSFLFQELFRIALVLKFSFSGSIEHQNPLNCLVNCLQLPLTVSICWDLLSYEKHLILSFKVLFVSLECFKGLLSSLQFYRFISGSQVMSTSSYLLTHLNRNS